MVKELVTIAQHMVLIPNNEGNYPLHIAIRNQQCYDVIYELFKALPEMAHMQDTETRLLPFMLSAMGKWNNEMDQIAITYQLLRDEPHLIRSA